MDYEKVIFLDHDGVIATFDEDYGIEDEDSFGFVYDPKDYNFIPDLDVFIYKFNSDCVKILNKIINDTNTEIVITSDWRTRFDMDKMKEIYELNKIIKFPIDYTENLFPEYNDINKLEVIRAMEIKRFLIKNKVNHYVVLDDLNMNKYFPKNFVYCNDTSQGIKLRGLKEKIIRLLNNI